MKRRTHSRGIAAEMTSRALFEVLEERQLLSTYFVSAGGSDSAAGGSSAPWATLQKAADQVQAGDVVQVAAGDYSGFQLSASGTASDPITFNFAPGAVIDGTPGTNNGEIDLSGCSYVTINGADVEGSNGARAGIWAGGEAYNNVNGILIENSTCNDCADWGFLGGFMNNSELLDDTFSNTQVQHGAYIGNSSNDDTVQGCTFFGNYACGFECNEDATQGGPGYGGGLVIDGNTFYDNAAGAGASINFDGVQDSIIENNVIYDAQRNGIALYQINGALPSTGNIIVNNTIDVNSTGDSGYAAIALLDGAADTSIYNNILSSAEDSLSIDAASQIGLSCDYNIFGASGIDPTGESYANNISLSDWQAMGFDTHSLYVGDAIGSLFAGATSGDFQLAGSSAAIGAGTSTDAPSNDLLGDARPTGGRYDIGAIQYQGTPIVTPPPVATPPPTIIAPTVTIAGATTATTGSSVTYTVSSTDTTADDLSGFTLDFGDGSTPVTAAASESLSDGIYTASVSFTHDYATPGTYVVTASASDSLGTTPAENSISVAASAPAAPGLDTPQIIVSGPTSAIVGTPVTYTATITNPTGNDGLTAGVFTIGDGSFTAPGTETDVNGVWTTTMTETYTYQNPSAGGDMVTFSAFDSFGEVAASNGVNTIVAAIPPTVTISGPTTATVGSLVTYTVLSTDTTADELSGFSMNFGDGSTSVPITASETLSNGVYTASATFTHDYATPGNYVVTASASDSLGTTPAQNSVSVVASAPTAPVLGVPLVTVSGPTSAIVGTPVTYTATATNPGGNDGLTGGFFTIGGVNYDVTGTETEIDGMWTSTMTITFTFQNPSAQGELVTFIADDSFGEVAGSDGINTIVAASTSGGILPAATPLADATTDNSGDASNDPGNSGSGCMKSRHFTEPAALESSDGDSNGGQVDLYVSVGRPWRRHHHRDWHDSTTAAAADTMPAMVTAD